MIQKLLALSLFLVISTVQAQSTEPKSVSQNLNNDSVSLDYTLESDEILLDDTIIVAPNPSATLIHITSKILPEQLELYDLKGKFIHRSQSNEYINFDVLNQGTYLLKLRYSDFTAIKKVVKK